MFRSGAAPGQTLAEGLISAERSARILVARQAPGSSLDDEEPLVAAWTRSALAASERVRRGVGRGTHPPELEAIIAKSPPQDLQPTRLPAVLLSPATVEYAAARCRCHRRCQQSRAPDVAVSVPSDRSFT